MIKKYKDAEEFFDQIISLFNYEKDICFDLDCDFLLFFILPETTGNSLLNCYTLFIETIKECYIRTYGSDSLSLIFKTWGTTYEFDISLGCMKDYKEKCIDLRRFGNLQNAIIGVNKKSTIQKLNEIKTNHIKDMIKDIALTEYNTSKDINRILKS